MRSRLLHRTIPGLAVVWLLVGCGDRGPDPAETGWPTSPGWHDVGTLGRAELPDDLCFDGLQPWLWALADDRVWPLGPGSGPALPLGQPGVEVLISTDPTGPRIALRTAEGAVLEGRPGALIHAADGATALASMLPRALYEAQGASGRRLDLDGPPSFAGQPSRQGGARFRAELRHSRVVLLVQEANGSVRAVTPQELPPTAQVELRGLDALDRAWLRIPRQLEELALVDARGRIVTRDLLPAAPRRFAVDAEGRPGVAEVVDGAVSLRLYVPPSP